MKIFIATYPFSKFNRSPLDQLSETGWEIVINPLGRRLKAGEVKRFINDADAVIAGTEPYTKDVLSECTNLKVINRVGIGLDSVDMAYCGERGINVTYTPEGPSQAVAELTVGNIINLTRNILPSDHSVREGAWNRYMGFLSSELTIGIVGIGRIGKRVCKLLQPFNATILANDIEPDLEFGKEYGVRWVSKDQLFRESDLVTIHIPYNESNHHYIDRKTISLMHTDSYFINTSRGSIVDEDALTDALCQKHLAGAALDVFEHEPYDGPLKKLDNVILTAHIAASARETRFQMEKVAVENCIRVLRNEKPVHDAIADTQFEATQNNLHYPIKFAENSDNEICLATNPQSISH